MDPTMMQNATQFQESQQSKQNLNTAGENPAVGASGDAGGAKNELTGGTPINTEDAEGNGELGTTANNSEGGTSDEVGTSGENANLDDGKGAEIPENLKAYAKTLESKGWKNPSDPETMEKILKSYQELESHVGQKGTRVGLYEQAMESLQGDITGGIDQINEARKRFGAEPLSIPDMNAITQQGIEAYEAVNQAVMAIRNGQSNPEAEQKVINYFESLKKSAEERQWAEKHGVGQIKPVDKSILQRNALSNVNNLSAATGQSRDDILKGVDFLLSDPDVGPLLVAQYGPDPLNIAQSKERLHILIGLSKRLMDTSGFNERVEKEVNARIKQMQKVTSQASTGGRVGGVSNNTSQKQDLSHLSHVADMFATGIHSGFVR